MIGHTIDTRTMAGRLDVEEHTMERRAMEGRANSLRSLGSLSSDRVVDTWRRLTFLRILIFNIGLSLADTLTDFLQAYAIIRMGDSTSPHHLLLGVAYMVAIWVPLPLVLAHLYTFLNTSGLRNSLALLVVLVIFWPLVPTVLYIGLLFSNREQLKDKEWRVRDKLINFHHHDITWPQQ